MLAVWLRTGGQERERCGLVRTFGTLWVGWERIEPYGSSGKLWNSVVEWETWETIWVEWEPVELYGLGGNPVEPCGLAGNLGGNTRQHHPLLSTWWGDGGDLGIILPLFVFEINIYICFCLRPKIPIFFFLYLYLFSSCRGGRCCQPKLHWTTGHTPLA